MKKQIFLLSVGLLMSAGQMFSTCETSCTTTCKTACDTSCDKCVPVHGKTFMSRTPHFQAASPELVSMYNSDAVSNLNKEDKHGIFEVTIFGGKSTKCSETAAAYLPYGHTKLTFDGSIEDPKIFASVLAQTTVTTTCPAVTTGTVAATDHTVLTTGAANEYSLTAINESTVLVDAATYKFDINQDTSKILPWNFGITFAALFEPRGAAADGSAAGSGLITSPAFKSTICPTYTYSHVGAGLALRYHFSDDKNGWFGTLTTAVQHVRSKFKLNETVVTEKTPLDSDNFTTADNPFGGSDVPGAFGNLATEAPKGSIAEAYFISGNPEAAFDSGFPAEENEANPPANVTEAFAQDAWKYGKVAGCDQKITRLADIELALGYQWMCGDCASTNWYVGVVIPTGNKAKAEFIAPAVVGNGQHAGIMTGSQTEVMLSDEAEYQAWYRLDINGRYLFRNTQKRSFDLLGNEWSRYMMVWENKEAYTAAVTATGPVYDISAVTTATQYKGNPSRSYTPGINVFTTDFYIKPQFQGRMNQAVYFVGEKFRAELGWNVFARQSDCVELACEWKNAPAFADASYLGGTGLNAHRTIYNDSQTTAFNAVDSLRRVSPASTSGSLITLANVALADTDYDDFAIGEEQISYDSVATPAALTHTPYLSLGYAFESDYKPVVAVGASYEFTASNHALNQWLVWGKFEIAF